MEWTLVLRLLVAGVLGAIIGLDREYRAKEAGFRTHFLVSLGSALFMIISQYGFEEVTKANGANYDGARVAAQIVSGIGFLGAGTIISRGRFQVTGLTTAAGLWATASIGLAVGIGFYEAAIVGTILVVLTMSILAKFDANIIRRSHRLPVYIEINNVAKMNSIIEYLIAEYGAKNIQVTIPRSGIEGNCGIEATLSVQNEGNGKEVISKLIECENIIYALPSI